MTPRIHELIEFLDRERSYLDDAVASVAHDQHNRRPSDEAWCVAQVVHHLAQSEAGMVGLLRRLTDEARVAGVAPDDSSAPILPQLEMKSVLDRSRRIKNPRANPSPEITTAQAMAELDGSRADLKALVSRQDLPNLGQVVAPHPAFGPISGYQWLAFAGAHMHRHADQIREIGAQLAG
jgi:hypothetical protein